MVVKSELERLGLKWVFVELGEVELFEEMTSTKHEAFKTAILGSGLELLDDKKSVLIQKIKNVIIDLVHYSEEPLSIKLSEYLSKKLNHDYTYLANLFSEVAGLTIEKFFIIHKIERVKELLVYNELNLNEIAYNIHYSSVSHLSFQFKKITGLTPSHFKKLKEKRRTMLDKL